MELGQLLRELRTTEAKGWQSIQSSQSCFSLLETPAVVVGSLGAMGLSPRCRSPWAGVSALLYGASLVLVWSSCTLVRLNPGRRALKGARWEGGDHGGTNERGGGTWQQRLLGIKSPNCCPTGRWDRALTCFRHIWCATIKRSWPSASYRA